jgi:transposase-like protein
MSRKSTIDSEKNVEIVERVLTDEISISESARLTGVDMASIRSWRNLYLSDGPTALMAQPSNKVYSQELKLQAVCEYLDGKSTQADILVEMITKYIHYYNSERIQRKLYRMTPMEFHAAFAAAA